ncbi:VOC family protein [Hyphomonas oceanitis]|uniref:VOC family protein n=1 Tax=Hyphomonas oceanitis TaxID=81033 RepID=UPI003001175B
MTEIPIVRPFLWYDSNALEAAEYYVSVIPDSRIVDVMRQDGAVLLVTFEIGGVLFTAMNGGPGHPHTDAFSISVTCKDQVEVDRIWSALTDGGSEVACGWLKDRFGLSWQVVPKKFYELMSAGTPEQSQRVMQAMMNMVKFDVAALEAAFEG